MKELTIRIESIEEFNARLVKDVAAGNATPDSYSFQSYADMQRTLTKNRMDILQVLMAGNALGIRDIARRISKDSGNVTRDMAALAEKGLVRKDKAGKYTTGYQRIRFDFEIGAAA